MIRGQGGGTSPSHHLEIVLPYRKEPRTCPGMGSYRWMSWRRGTEVESCHPWGQGGSRAHDLGGPPFLNGEGAKVPSGSIFLPWHLLRPPSSLISLRGVPASDVEALRERLRTAGLDDSIPSESASSSAAGQSSSSSSASSSTASKGDFGQCAYRGGVNCKNTGRIGKDLKRKVNPDDSTDPDDMKRTNGSSYISSMTRGLRYTAREDR